MRQATTTHTGYLAILVTALMLCVGIKYEINRQYLVAWQHHLETQQNKSKDYVKRVKSFFAALNDNLGTLSSLPSIRSLDQTGRNFTSADRETIQQVYNNLAKNVDVTKVYVLQSGFDPTKVDSSTGELQTPALTLDQVIMPSRSLLVAPPAVPNLQTGNHDEEFDQLQHHLSWFKNNYPDINTLRGASVPMVSGPEIQTSDTSNSIKKIEDADRQGLIFSVPFYGADGKFAGGISTVVLSNVLRSVTDNEKYTLISPLAEFISAFPKRDANIKMMMHANEQTPESTTIFSEAIVIDTHDARGKWQLNIQYPVADYYASAQFNAIHYSEIGAYSALMLLTLAGLGWHRSNLRRALEMKNNTTALQSVNDDISKLNHELADNVKKLHEAQDEIIKKGKLAQMGQLVATVAHELRNPLSSVRTSAFLLRRKLANLPINVEAQLLRIDNAIARCDAVITQFLDYAKSHRMEFISQNFDDWVEKIIEEEAPKLPAAVSVECILGLDNLKVSFDQSRLSRALINLMSNASEAMVGKGEDPSKFACASPKITVITRLTAGNVEIDVCDNGPGIAEENLSKILEPLFTTKNFGTGLGLPAVIQVLEQHGGGIKVIGGFGTGATFTAWFPLSYQQEEAAA